MEIPREIQRIFKNSEKAKLLEELAEELKTMDKAVIVLIEDKENGGYSSTVLTLGINNSYEAYGILEAAKRDLQEDES